MLVDLVEDLGHGSKGTVSPMTQAKTDGEEAAESGSAGLRSRLRAGISAVSPEWTRRATWIERQTVQRLSWTWLVRINRALEVLGRLATLAYVVFAATIVFGVDWKHVIENMLNSGAPVRGAIALVIILPTLLFVALHSLTGYGRWRVQRELWRRDVERLHRLEAERTQRG
jgi:hypothetical protein